MKKGLVLLAGVALWMAACNNSGETLEERKDSVLEKIDSSVDAKVDSVQESGDSLKNLVKGTFEKTDSANKAISDSAAKSRRR